MLLLKITAPIAIIYFAGITGIDSTEMGHIKNKYAIVYEDILTLCKC